MYKTENELVESIISHIHSIPLKGTKRSIFRELNLGYGIADVVAVSHAKRISTQKDFLAYFDISLLSLIEKKEKMSMEDIVYITKYPHKKISNSLTSLLKKKYIVFRHGYYTSHKKYIEILTDSIAVEAKLKNWKRALKQAYRYKWFANKSFVFLPIENITVPKKNLHLFERYNVGLASVSDDNGIEIIFAPKEEQPVSGQMRIALNEHLLSYHNSRRRST